MAENEFAGVKAPCDLVLKGGMASDVVYPLAIVEIAKKYRLGSIGGTSSGAIAAAGAAAAEYARETGGFERLAAVPAATLEMPPIKQFQPVPRLKPLFKIFLTVTGSSSSLVKGVKLLSAVVAGYPGALAIGLAPGLLIAVLALSSHSYGWIFFDLLLAGLGATLSLFLRTLRAFGKELAEENYGLCSGHRIDGNPAPGFSDYLLEMVERVSGKPPGAGPLTFGDLESKRPPIRLATMTTDLSTQRPYQLPFQGDAREEHFFSKGDFAKLFPAHIVEAMCRDKRPIKLDPCWRNCPEDLYPFPDKNELPIVVAARMSLSFPILIQAVPLYKRDRTLIRDSDQPRKCLFSDGGLTSNFPIHFFDRLWPNSPTFGIAFDDFSNQRHLTGMNEIRVEMGRDLRDGRSLPIVPINGTGEFLTRLGDVARNWRDNLQSVLPGYRERIVHVHLKPDEGGLNLDMPPELIRRLTEIGSEAGALVTGPTFNMDEHRWRRFLIAMADIEQVLDELAQSYEHSSLPGGTFGEFLERFGYHGSYPPKDEAWKEETLRRAKELVGLGERWREKPTVRSGRIPKPDSDLRIEPRE
jgi:hypothetical protein